MSGRLWRANNWKKQRLMEKSCSEAIRSLRKQNTSARTFEVFEIAAEKKLMGIKW
jgi:hypothetical protein